MLEYMENPVLELWKNCTFTGFQGRLQVQNVNLVTWDGDFSNGFLCLQIHRIHLWSNSRQARHSSLQTTYYQVSHPQSSPLFQQATQWVPALLRHSQRRNQNPYNFPGVRKNEVSCCDLLPSLGGFRFAIMWLIAVLRSLPDCLINDGGHLLTERWCLVLKVVMWWGCLHSNSSVLCWFPLWNVGVSIKPKVKQSAECTFRSLGLNEMIAFMLILLVGGNDTVEGSLTVDFLLFFSKRIPRARRESPNSTGSHCPWRRCCFCLPYEINHWGTPSSKSRSLIFLAW